MRDPDLPKSFWKSKTFLVLATFCVTILLLSAYVFLLRTPPLIISEATTRITGPLTADGQIDFFKALEERISSPELATDDNGFRDFVRLFGDVGVTGGDLEFHRLQKYEKLGLDPTTPPTQILPLAPDAAFQKIFVARGEEIPWEQNRHLCSQPWTLEEFPMLADWVNEIDVPMDAIAEAIRKPIFFAPLLQDEGKNLVTLMPDASLFRQFSRIYRTRALYRVGQGDIDGAIDDKLTIHRLGRLAAQNGRITSYLIANAIEGDAARIPIGANPEHPLTERQLQRLFDNLDVLPPRRPVSDIYEQERLVALSCIQTFAKQGPQYDSLAGGAGPFTRGLFLMHGPNDFMSAYVSRTCNWNIVFRRMNEVYDAIQAPNLRTKYHSLVKPSTPSMFDMVWRLLSPNGRGTLAADYLINLLVPDVEKVEETIRCSQCAENMQRLALAILLYRCENGEFPDENWATQIEKYLGENPQRYFSCPTSPSPDGETTYALVQYGDIVANCPDLLLVELTAPVPLDKAVIFADDVLACKGTGSLHPGGMNAACRSAAVRFLLSNTDAKELERLLGRQNKPSP